MQSNPVKVKRGQQLTHEGQTGHKAFILQAGWACSFKLLPNGGRQIISFPIAGDIVGLRSVLLRTADHSFSALTDAIVNPVEGTHIMKCVTDFPRLGAALMWAASRDEAMVGKLEGRSKARIRFRGRGTCAPHPFFFFFSLGSRVCFPLPRSRRLPCRIRRPSLGDCGSRHSASFEQSG